MRIKWFSLVRITGLLLVLLYHFFKNSFPGGFVGVDIFFTFSGFLITALLIDEFSKTKKIDFVSFCRRRFYRIFPPLVLMVLVTIPFVFLVKSDFRASIGSQIMTALGFTSNFYEILTGGNYESQFIPHLFVHTWSLSIEVHFYVLWG
ncbi:MAG: acyltransferase, partial [Streptococcus agalactiae]|nr:acyltransferase [Streptococcus agalactiae]